MKIILLILIFVYGCREYSYEGGPVPVDTIPNELVTRCSIYIVDEASLKWIYPQETNKLYIGTYKIFDSIEMNGSHLYQRSFDLKSYLPMDKFKIGDSFFVRYEIRWKIPPATFVQHDTLIY